MAHVKYRERFAVWKAMRRLKKFTPKEVSTESKTKQGYVSLYLRGLMKAGYVECINADDVKNRGRIYSLTKLASIMPPQIDAHGRALKKSTGAKVWPAIKVLKVFCIKDVCLAAQTEYALTQNYIQALSQAGYIKKKNSIRGHMGPSSFIFLSSKDTGPLAPCLLIDGSLYDPNTDATINLGAAA